MMRSWNAEQENLYQQYAILGKHIAKSLGDCQKQPIFNDRAWNLVAEEGIWRLPVAKKYGGVGLSWQDYAAATEGLFATYNNLIFLSSLIAQSSTLYFFLQQGSEAQKKAYLPRLMQGEGACIAIAESLEKFNIKNLQTHAFPTEKKYQLMGHKTQIINAAIAEIMIVTARISTSDKKNEFAFFILDKKIDGIKIKTNKSGTAADILLDNVIVGDESILNTSGKNFSALYEVMSFERLLYSLLATGFARSIIDECKLLNQQPQASKSNLFARIQCASIENNLKTSQEMLYTALKHSHLASGKSKG